MFIDVAVIVYGLGRGVGVNCGLEGGGVIEYFGQGGGFGRRGEGPVEDIGG